MAIGESTGTELRTGRTATHSSHRESVGYFFIAPALFILAITSVYPVIYSLAEKLHPALNQPQFLAGAGPNLLLCRRRGCG
jgi:hypothetical protein